MLWNDSEKDIILDKKSFPESIIQLAYTHEQSKKTEVFYTFRMILVLYVFDKHILFIFEPF